MSDEETIQEEEGTDVGTVTEENLEEQVASRTSKGSKKAKKSPAKAKTAAQAKGKAGRPAVKKVGVIAVIAEQVSQKDGASAIEIGKALAKKFPDRDAEGMLTTVRIQITRLAKRFGFEMRKFKDEKRGLVYKAPANLPSLLAKGKTKEE
jgi:hypothetical protein